MAAKEAPFSDIEATLKRCVQALEEAELPFLLAGSLASWARGGPETRHDLDFMVPPAHAERALEVLEAAGMRTERPPEQWLFKAWDGEVLIDLIFEPSGLEVSDEVFERADRLEILAVAVPVIALEDLMVTKLMSLDEHALDYEPSLKIARALREQIDWGQLRARTAGSPFAEAFFTLVEGLGIAELQQADESQRRRIRVVP